MTDRLIHYPRGLSVYLVILSVDRNPNYLLQTRKSLQSQNIRYDISQGSVSTANLEGINDPNCRGLVAPECYEDGYADKGVLYKSQINYINSLTMPNGSGIKETFRIILEDDIIVCSNFLQHLYTYLQAVIPRANYPGVVLSLYTPYKTKTKKCEPRYGLASTFYGTQGMVYSGDLCRRFADYIRHNICTRPYDFLLDDFCKANHIPICWASLSLVQHMGQVSTGLGHHHQTSNFLDDVLPRAKSTAW